MLLLSRAAGDTFENSSLDGGRRGTTVSKTRSKLRGPSGSVHCLNEDLVMMMMLI